MIRTAILIDGAFYRKRAYNLFGNKTPAERAKELSSYCHRHIKDEKEGASLYRVFYYDCPPINKQVYHPLLKKAVDLGKTAMRSPIKDDLFEHIDGIRTKAPKLCPNTK